MGTTLTLPTLARYWVSWRSGDLSEAELLEAARAITAYVVLRRAVTGGTAGIDSELRRLMHPNPTTGGGPFCAGINRHNDLVPVATLKTELRDRYLKNPAMRKIETHGLAAPAPCPWRAVLVHYVGFFCLRLPTTHCRMLRRSGC